MYWICNLVAHRSVGTPKKIWIRSTELKTLFVSCPVFPHLWSHLHLLHPLPQWWCITPTATLNCIPPSPLPPSPFYSSWHSWPYSYAQNNCLCSFCLSIWVFTPLIRVVLCIIYLCSYMHIKIRSSRYQIPPTWLHSDNNISMAHMYITNTMLPPDYPSPKLIKPKKVTVLILYYMEYISYYCTYILNKYQ